MRLVIQRVLHAEVQVDGNTIGKIGKGLLVFVGAGQDDTKEIADKYLRKLLGLRSLPYMQTVRKEIGQALSKPENHIWRKLCMNI